MEELDPKVLEQFQWGDNPELELKILPLGIPTLDKLLGGGLRQGHYIEIIGAYSSGKTYFCQLATRAAQAAGLSTFLIDTEKSYNPVWWAKSGVDTKALSVSRPPNGETAVDLIRALCRAEAGLVILDSIAATVPVAELEKTAAESTVGAHARLMGKLFRDVLQENQKTIVAVINQSRKSIGVTYGSNETLPGGEAQTYYAWHLLRIRRKDWIMEKVGKDEERVGFNMSFELEKSKQSTPWRKAVIPFRFDSGLNVLASVLDEAVALGVIEVRGGGNYYLDGTRINVRGRNEMLAELESNEALQQRLISAIS